MHTPVLAGNYWRHLWSTLSRHEIGHCSEEDEEHVKEREEAVHCYYDRCRHILKLIVVEAAPSLRGLLITVGIDSPDDQLKSRKSTNILLVGKPETVGVLSVSLVDDERLPLRSSSTPVLHWSLFKEEKQQQLAGGWLVLVVGAVFSFISRVWHPPPTLWWD